MQTFTSRMEAHDRQTLSDLSFGHARRVCYRGLLQLRAGPDGDSYGGSHSHERADAFALTDSRANSDSYPGAITVADA